MKKLHCFRNQFNFKPHRFIYLRVPPASLKEHNKNVEQSTSQTLEGIRLQGKKSRIELKYNDDLTQNNESLLKYREENREKILEKHGLNEHLVKSLLDQGITVTSNNCR